MIRRLLILLIAVAFNVEGVLAQQDGERTVVRIEAEIITGLGVAAPGGPQIPGGPISTDLSQPDGDGLADGGAVPSVGAPSQNVDDVAVQLMTSAQTGSLSVTDTSMVAALHASRSNRQNLDALVTITVIDEQGNIKTTTMRNTDLRSELIAPSTGLQGITLQDAAATPSSQQVLATGDIMRRSSGTTYFYVQVCSCGL